MELEFDVKMTPAAMYDYLMHHTYSGMSGIIGAIAGAFCIMVFVANKYVMSVSEQLADSDSLLNTYKRIIKVRNENIALKYGNNISIYEKNTTQLQGFYREFTFEGQTQKVLVIHNLSIKPIDFEPISGKVIYLSGTDNPVMPTTLPAKSTIIIDVTGE